MTTSSLFTLAHIQTKSSRRGPRVPFQCSPTPRTGPHFRCSPTPRTGPPCPALSTPSERGSNPLRRRVQSGGDCILILRWIEVNPSQNNRTRMSVLRSPRRWNKSPRIKLARRDLMTGVSVCHWLYVYSQKSPVPLNVSVCRALAGFGYSCCNFKHE